MKILVIILIILLLVFLLTIGLSWLVFGIVLINALYFGVIKLISLIKSTFFKRFIKGVFTFVFITVLVISLKLVTFDVFKIPSSSMENLLFPKDIILVNKLKYGPKLPRSPFDIPLINTAYYFNDNARKKIKKYWWQYKRLSGTTKVKQGDVFVFNYAFNKNYIIVKRCVALSGDTLNIKNGEIYTNKKQYKSNNSIKNNYKFIAKNKTILRKALDSFSNNIILKGHSKFNEAKLTEFQLKHFKRQNYIDSVSMQIDTFIPKKTFVKSIHLRWTFDNMGPLVVPKKGMEIELNQKNFELYKRAINSCENSKIKKTDGVYYVDNKKATHYTFKQNYYFMMGDNRKGTMDSRRWGFVPESNIIGKVQCVLFSNYNEKFNWNRLFKAIN